MPAQSTWPQLRIHSEDDAHIADVLAANGLRTAEFCDDQGSGRLLTLTESLHDKGLTLASFRERVEQLFEVYYSDVSVTILDSEIDTERLASPDIDLGDFDVIEVSDFIFTTCWTRATVEAALKRAGLRHATVIE